MEVGDAIVMFVNILPYLHGMFVITIERPVNELHLFYDFDPGKNLQFSFYDIYVTVVSLFYLWRTGNSCTGKGILYWSHNR